MVNSSFSEGATVRILSSGRMATILSIVEGHDGKEALVYLIETEDRNMHHFLNYHEIELNKNL